MPYACLTSIFTLDVNFGVSKKEYVNLDGIQDGKMALCLTYYIAQNKINQEFSKEKFIPLTDKRSCP